MTSWHRMTSLRRNSAEGSCCRWWSVGSRASWRHVRCVESESWCRRWRRHQRGIILRIATEPWFPSLCPTMRQPQYQSQIYIYLNFSQVSVNYLSGSESAKLVLLTKQPLHNWYSFADVTAYRVRQQRVWRHLNGAGKCGRTGPATGSRFLVDFLATRLRPITSRY